MQVPESAIGLQLKLCKQLHIESGHASYLEAHDMLAERYIWPRMATQMVELWRKITKQCKDHITSKTHPKSKLIEG